MAVRLSLSNGDDATNGPYRANGGEGTYSVQGTFGGATVDLQYTPPGFATKSAFDSATTVTAAANERFVADAGMDMYVVVTNTSGTTSLEVYLSGVVDENA